MIMDKRFSGIMDKDSREDDVLKPNHTDARNVRFVNGSLQNIKGNTVISNSNLPSGTNEANGVFYDQLNNRILWFNYNSNGNSGLYQLSLQTGIITQIFRCGIHSATDILGLSLDYPVTSMAIVYRPEGEGDLLYWTNGYGRPMYLNLDTVGDLAPFTSDMINAAKNAPLEPPTCTYQDDADNDTNSLRRKLVRFRYRWVYKNGEKSTWSPISKVPLPVNDNNPTTQNDPTKNNYIEVVMTAGGNDSKAIQLGVQESLGTVWGDLRLVDTFDMDDYSIAPGASFSFDFYNNGAYVAQDIRETDLLFDWVPDKANALELLNGDVLIYAGITDGYAPLTREQVEVTLTSSLTSIPSPYGSSLKWNDLYRYGLVYYDDRGKSYGVTSFAADPIDTTDFSVATPNYAASGSVTEIPRINASINHTPPTWATKYQWVRTARQVAGNFLYFQSNDYQVENGYIYICIQSLVDQKSSNTGFVPSYEFTSGDRVRVLARTNPFLTPQVVPFDTQLDLEILGTAERIMTSPASTGLFIKCAQPTVFPTGGFTNRMLIELYTPQVKPNDSQQLFYEFGECYDIYESGGQRYHRGQTQDQTAIQPALFQWTEGDVYYRERIFSERLLFLNIRLETLIMDANYSDYFVSAVNSNGRAWPINNEAREEYNPVMLRWGGKFQSGTNINNINRFYFDEFAEADRSKGDIRRLKVRDRILRVFQDRGVGQYGVYARFIQNNEGQSELITTNEIITANNIQYYQGTYGLCGYATNLTSTQLSDYFIDVVTGRAIRLSSDGITDLGLLYYGQYALAELALPYNKQLLRSNGSVAKIIVFFDYFDNDAHFILQAGTGGGETTEGQHFSFHESSREEQKGFRCFYDYHPEFALSAGNVVYSWKNGALYRHDSSTYCNFYGVQYGVDATYVFNDNLPQKKSWHSVTEIASDIFECPEIYTNAQSYSGQRQETTLVPAEFTKFENVPSAAFKRDSNSSGGKVNGDTMKGNWVSMKFKKQNASSLIEMSEILVTYVDSPLTSR